MPPILSLPELYHNEDFRSIIHRYHLRSANNSIKITSLELFGTKTMAYGHIPRRLSYFISKLPIKNRPTEEYFLENHTNVSFYKSFISNNEFSKYLNNIREGRKTNSYKPTKMLGVKPVKMLTNIKYCPECLLQDYQIHGECYAHLMHQIEFLDCCMVHINVKLIDSCHICNETFSVEKASLCITPYCSNNHDLTTKINTEVEDRDMKVMLYENFVQVQKYSNYLSPAYIRHKLYSALGNKGYVHFRGKIFKKKLINELCDYFSDRLIKKMNFERNSLLGRSNIINIFTEKHIRNFPFLYFLLIIFIFGSVNEFIQYKETYSIPLPFREGINYCLNNICEGYNKSVINNIVVSDKNNNLVGSFKCELCGFIYSRTYIENVLPKNNRMKILSYGHLWIKTILTLYFDQKSIFYISKKINSSPETIRKHLAIALEGYNLKKQKINEENLLFLVNRYLEQSTQHPTQEVYINKKRNQYRERVLALLTKNQQITRKEIKYREKTATTWLIRNDSDWLNKLLPYKSSLKYNNHELDLRDRELSEKIQDIGIILYQSPPTGRISKNLILQELSAYDRKFIEKYESLLLRTQKVLNDNLECINAYLLRNLPRAIIKAKKNGWKTIKYSTLCRTTELYKKSSQETKEIIEAELLRYQD